MLAGRRHSHEPALLALPSATPAGLCSTALHVALCRQAVALGALLAACSPRVDELEGAVDEVAQVVVQLRVVLGRKVVPLEGCIREGGRNGWCYKTQCAWLQSRPTGRLHTRSVGT